MRGSSRNCEGLGAVTRKRWFVGTNDSFRAADVHQPGRRRLPARSVGRGVLEIVRAGDAGEGVNLAKLNYGLERSAPSRRRDDVRAASAYCPGALAHVEGG